MFAKTLTAAAFVLASTTAPGAQSVVNGLEGVMRILENQGYDEIEVDRDDDEITIYAERGNQDRTLIYDASTGTLLSDRSVIDEDQDDDENDGRRNASDDEDQRGRDDDDDDNDRGDDDDDDSRDRDDRGGDDRGRDDGGDDDRDGDDD